MVFWEFVGELPALRDGSRTVAGFENIVEHLRKISSGQWDLDAHLSPMQKADCLAYVHPFPLSAPTFSLFSAGFLYSVS